MHKYLLLEIKSCTSMAMKLNSKENIKMFKNKKNISGFEKKNKKNVPHNITHSQETKCFNKEYFYIL